MERTCSIDSGSVFHFRIEKEGADVAEDQRSADSGGTGLETAKEKAEGALFINAFPDSFKKSIPEAEERNGRSGAGPLDKGIVDSEKAKKRAGAHKKYHDAAGHQLCPIHQNLDQGADGASD